MVITHNINAMNSKRNLTNNQKGIAGNLEKLSSGYRINRSADDAAGLAISEKMRAQVTGLQTAYENVEDGMNLIKTGEGAMQEIHDMLNRMKELSVQSANGTYDDSVDREALQKEVDALIKEIDRIADSTNHNNVFMLSGDANGSVGSGSVGDSGSSGEHVINPNDGIGIDKVTSSKGNYSVGFDTKNGYSTAGSNFTNSNSGGSPIGTFTMNYTGSGGTSSSVTVSYFNVFDERNIAETLQDLLQTQGVGVQIFMDGNNMVFQMNDQSSTIDSIVNYNGTSADLTNVETTYEYVDLAGMGNGDSVTIDGTTYVLKDSSYTGSLPAGTVIDAGTAPGDVLDANFVAALFVNGADVITEIGSTKIYAPVSVEKVESGSSGSTDGSDSSGGTTSTGPRTEIVLQIGETGDTFNRLEVPVFNMHAVALGVDPFDISNQDAAQYSIDKSDDAINFVSTCRSDYGALQNRLEHTGQALSIMAENIQDAESTIRDTDMAEEMMEYTKNNILIQSSQSMLAQANQLPQGVLQLLG